MSLTLSIVNVERLENGVSLELALDRHGAVIGRSLHADWSLPDPSNHISSTHCEINYRDGAYILTDNSTNGTFVNGATARLQGPYTIAEGDELVIGHYRILASLNAASQTAPPQRAPAPAPEAGGRWADWNSD